MIEYSPDLVIPADFTVDELDIIYTCLIMTAHAHQRMVKERPDFGIDQDNIDQMFDAAQRVKELLPSYSFAIDQEYGLS